MHAMVDDDEELADEVLFAEFQNLHGVALFADQPVAKGAQRIEIGAPRINLRLELLVPLEELFGARSVLCQFI